MINSEEKIKFNLSNPNRLIDISELIFENISKSLEILKLKSINSFNGESILFGLTLDSEKLLLPDLKIKCIKLLEFFINDLIEPLPDLNEKEHLKRKIRLSLDRASNSFFIAVELFRLSTKITIKSIPIETTKQISFHLENEYMETIHLSCYSKMFKPNLISIRQLNNDYFKYSKFKADFFYGFTEFDLYISTLVNLKVDNIRFILNKDPVIKMLQLEYLLRKLKTFIPNEELKQHFNIVRIILNDPFLLSGIKVELLD